MTLSHLQSLLKSGHPRPKLIRDNYLLLDGEWNFELSSTNVPLQYLSKTIKVPFAPESMQSGLYIRVEGDQYLHYSTQFNMSNIGKKTLIHFQAVDQECDVYCNSIYIGSHSGGYTSFTFDVTDTLKEGINSLYIVVNDKTELAPYGRGKQRLNNTGSMASIFYTPVSGIWQSVWIEHVPEDYIYSISLKASYLHKEIEIEIKTHSKNTSYNIEVFDENLLIHSQVLESNINHKIILDNIQAWSPDEPKLYYVKVSNSHDEVLSYVGFRDIKSKADVKNIMRFYLNDKPIFMSGVLDQGYWHQTLLTPPNDEALINDIMLIKEMGFNTLRKHVKVESERFYYHCDVLGMLVWQDIPNGGDDYNFNVVTYLPNISDFISRHIKDSNYSLLGRKSKNSRDIYYTELIEILNQLQHYPSIVVWVPFNEGWGQFDANKASDLIKEKDPSRLINEACGWFDQGGGDIHSIHSYFKPLRTKAKSRVVALSEFGGHSLAIPNHTYGNKNFGYKKINASNVNESYQKLYKLKVIRNIKSGLSASIVTQLSDVYNEINGLITFDRKVIKVSKDTMQDIHQEIYAVYEKVSK